MSFSPAEVGEGKGGSWDSGLSECDRCFSSFSSSFFCGIACGDFALLARQWQSDVCLLALIAFFFFFFSSCPSPQDTPQSDRGLHHGSILGEHRSGQTVPPSHQGPHPQEQESGQHGPARLQRELKKNKKRNKPQRAPGTHQSNCTRCREHTSQTADKAIKVSA